MSEIAAGRISLSDDGTMDTVLSCTCGQELRYNMGEHEDGCEVDDYDRQCVREEDATCECLDRFVDWAIEDAEATHECIRTES